MKRLSIMDVCLSLLILVIVGAALAPALARVERNWQDAACQSNLRRWAEAMELYTADSGERYPTNRVIQGGGTLGPIYFEVNLSRQDPTTGDPLINPATGKPYRFDHSINWVEALYPYLWARAEKTGQDWKSWMRCPSASTNKAQPLWNCAVTYAFNGTLAEYWPGIVRQPEKVMMLREMGCRAPAELRPVEGRWPYVGDPADAPTLAFLNAGGQVDYSKVHGNGSYILFADGHVKHFTVDFYPVKNTNWANNAFDTDTEQWYNYVYTTPANDTQRMLNRTIAITP